MTSKGRILISAAAHRLRPQGPLLGAKHCDLLSGGNLTADVEHQSIARPHPGRQFHQTPIVTRDRHGLECNLAVVIDVRDLRAGRSEYERRRNVDVHAGHELVVGIGHVDLHPHRARLHIHGLR